MFDFARGTLTRFTIEGGGHSPIWSPDGTRLAFTMEGPATGGKSRIYLSAAWGEFEATVSPDGQWIAYTTRETGRNEIQVRRFTQPEPTGKWKVTSTGAHLPRWSGDGRTLYFINGDQTEVQAMADTTGAEFTVGPVRTIMSGKEIGQGWDVDRTTGRIAVTVPVTLAGVRIVVIEHWLDAFKRKVAQAGAAK